MTASHTAICPTRLTLCVNADAQTVRADALIEEVEEEEDTMPDSDSSQ
jgi:hypothetical protein